MESLQQKMMNVFLWKHKQKKCDRFCVLGQAQLATQRLTPHLSHEIGSVRPPPSLSDDQGYDLRHDIHPDRDEDQIVPEPKFRIFQ